MHSKFFNVIFHFVSCMLKQGIHFVSLCNISYVDESLDDLKL